MKKTFLLLVLAASIFSCKSDDDSATETDNITSAELTILDSANNPVDGIVIYAYAENTWEVIGDDTQFADFTAASDSEGKAVFSNLTSDLTFNELNNFQQTFRFSAHYTSNNTETTTVKAITFNLGDDKTDTINID